MVSLQFKQLLNCKKLELNITKPSLGIEPRTSSLQD